MNRKSCLVQLVFFILIMTVLVTAIQRCRTQPEVAQSALSPSRATAPSAPLPSLWERVKGALPFWGGNSSHIAPSPEPTPTLDLEHMGIKGLGLPIVQPLLFEIPKVRGLEVAGETLYIAGYDADHKVGLLYQTNREGRAILQMRTYAQGALYRLGGVHLGPDRLWVPLSADDEAYPGLILGLDPLYLTVTHSFETPEAIRAVAQVDAYTLVGVNEAGTTLYRWALDGTPLNKGASPADIHYKDMDVIRGSLVAAGKTTDRMGALDVLDPATLSLLVRYPCYGRSPTGELVTSRGFGFDGEHFYFLPEQGKFPSLMIYELAQGSLADYIPSTAEP